MLIIETLGTGYAFPTPPEKLIPYYDFLEKSGFSFTWIRTDYQFSSRGSSSTDPLSVMNWHARWKPPLQHHPAGVHWTLGGNKQNQQIRLFDQPDCHVPLPNFGSRYYQAIRTTSSDFAVTLFHITLTVHHGDVRHRRRSHHAPPCVPGSIRLCLVKVPSVTAWLTASSYALCMSAWNVSLNAAPSGQSSGQLPPGSGDHLPLPG